MTVTSGPQAGTSLVLERELVVGRGEADLKIADEELSRRHAAIRLLDAGVVVEDLGSLNGTFVDGERIAGPVTLVADATIRVGRSELQVAVAMPAPPEPAEDPGRTRLAKVPPPEPQMTRMRPAPSAEPSAPPAIPQPQVTRVRATPSADPREPIASPPEPVEPPEPVDPQVTRVSAAVPADDRRPGLFRRLLARVRGRGGEDGKTGR